MMQGFMDMLKKNTPVVKSTENMYNVKHGNE